MTEFNYLVISDVHLGHRRTPTEAIIEHLDETLIPRLTDEVDALFIAGDLFDQLLDYSMDEIAIIDLFLGRLFKRCAKYDICVRILEGTPSHDRRQARHLYRLIALMELPLNYRYIDTLCVETLDPYGVTVLYIPDEWQERSELTLADAKAALEQAGLAQVDLTIMHGQFHYQLTNVPETISRHQEEDYLSLTRYYIHVGHIHTHSVYDRIIASGSFDRLAHGEEEPKGFIQARIGAGGLSYEFIENVNATTYKTITLKTTETEALFAYLDKTLAKYRSGSFIRLSAKTKIDPELLTALKVRYSDYHLSVKPIEAKSATRIDAQTLPAYDAFSLTQANLKTLLTQAIESKYQFDEAKWRYYHEVTQEL